jgi:hypothetical protein
MINIHFGKRIIETFLLETIAGQMTSLNKVIWQVLFYYIFIGGIVGFKLYNPK